MDRVTLAFGVYTMDEELERLKRRKMRELRRKMMQESAEDVEAKPPEEPTPREILDSRFKGRAWEVWEHREGPELFCYSMGDANRLPNGNTLITFSNHGRIVQPAGPF